MPGGSAAGSGPVLAGGPGADATPAGGRQVILAAATSLQDSGLHRRLVPRFERLTGYEIKTASGGTGAALALLVNVILVWRPGEPR